MVVNLLKYFCGSGGLALDTIAEVRQLYQLLKHFPMNDIFRLTLHDDPHYVIARSEATWQSASLTMSDAELPAKGERIATPVCAPVRNDTEWGSRLR